MSRLSNWLESSGCSVLGSLLCVFLLVGELVLAVFRKSECDVCKIPP